jgi:hypothetical protein
MSEKVVRIIEDCRKTDTPATGQLGMYEGDFPRSVAVKTRSGGFAEYCHQDWETIPADQKPPELKRGEPKPEPPFFLVMDNPRIRLADGSYIWGDECWWSDRIDTSLEELQKEVDLFRGVYAAMIAAP